MSFSQPVRCSSYQWDDWTERDPDDFMIVGGLHVPFFSDIPGYESFKGDKWHAAQWRHDVNLSGKRVGVIGTGCSGTQIVPAISEDSSVQVVNFCRTPSWFIEKVYFTTSWFQPLRHESLTTLSKSGKPQIQEGAMALSIHSLRLSPISLLDLRHCQFPFFASDTLRY